MGQMTNTSIVLRFIETKQDKKKVEFVTKQYEELTRDHLVLEKVSHHYYYYY